jgi:hypothetical protein
MRPVCALARATPAARVMLLLSLIVMPGAAPALAQATGEPPEQTHDEGETGPGMVLRAFGAVQWGTTQVEDVPNTFTLGQFALFATSALTDRINVLAEVVMEASTDTRVVTDLERLQLTYRFDDSLQLSAGRYHTGIGFYNAAFHHGAFFETPLGRPRAFAFEDEGGVLPVHDVGLTARGVVPRTGFALHYVAEIGNGRRWDVDHESEDAHDSNSAKALNFGLSVRPPSWPGFEAGGSWYRDEIASGASGTGDDVLHHIGVAYVTYRTPETEIMAEWLRLTHRLPGADTYVNHTGYVQLARAVRGVKPYYRYDRQSINPQTPIIGHIESFTGHTLGVRVEAAQWVGVKVQYERATHGSLRGVDAFRTQLVFVF